MLISYGTGGKRPKVAKVSRAKPLLGSIDVKMF